jgi:hypothetical protein
MHHSHDIKTGLYHFFPVLFCFFLFTGQHVMGQEAQRLTDTVSVDTGAIERAEPVTFRTVPDSLAQRMKQDKDFAYANDPAYWLREPVKQQRDFWEDLQYRINQKWIKRTLFVLLGSILLFALYKIVLVNKLYMFYSSPPGESNADDAELDIQQVDFEEKIHAAIQAKNYRDAVRYMYLKALKLADEQGLIQFQVHATNQEYVQQMQHHPQGRHFRMLTRAYEYTWYGGFEVSAAQFERLKEDFDIFYKITRR